MLRAYRVKNLRSIGDSDFLELRPIVVFVGRNSSGKSTLLRLLPLLKQSVSEDTREPILWYGRSADFGSFEEAKNKFSSSEGITFEFRFEMSTTSGYETVLTAAGERVLYSYGGNRRLFARDTPVAVEIAITVMQRSTGEGTFVSSIETRIGDDLLSILANEDGEVEPPIFNGTSLPDNPPVRLLFGKGRFFPVLQPAPTDVGLDEPRRTSAVTVSDGPYLEPLANRLAHFVHGNTKRQTLRQLAGTLVFDEAGEFLKNLISRAAPPKSRIRLDQIRNASPSEIERLRAAVLLRLLTPIFREASTQLNEFGASVRYLEPVRATATRYYRFQELAIDEIDPQGQNVPMFLSSLGYSEQKNLETWMTQALGFNVRATKVGGHARLLVREADGIHETNLADTGFGYSQVLPIALQLWKSGRDTSKRARNRARQQVIAVEQPELHLHPQLQALLADLFALSVNAAKAAQTTLSVVVETHSEHIVNRLGALVEKGTLSPEDIIVYLVERDSPNGQTTVRSTTFSKSGSLNDPWPFGFFSPQLP